MAVGAGKRPLPRRGTDAAGVVIYARRAPGGADTLDWWGGLIDLPNVESFAAPPTRPSRFPHSTGSLSRHRRTATPLPVTRRPIGTFIRAPPAHVAPTIGIRATRRPRRESDSTYGRQAARDDYAEETQGLTDFSVNAGYRRYAR